MVCKKTTVMLKNITKEPERVFNVSENEDKYKRERVLKQFILFFKVLERTKKKNEKQIQGIIQFTIIIIIIQLTKQLKYSHSPYSFYHCTKTLIRDFLCEQLKKIQLFQFVK